MQPPHEKDDDNNNRVVSDDTEEAKKKGKIAKTYSSSRTQELMYQFR
jgi:hypothetical protein